MYIAKRWSHVGEVSEVFPRKSSHFLQYILHFNGFLDNIYESLDIYKTEITLAFSLGQKPPPKNRGCSRQVVGPSNKNLMV
jgi:hypothetical protein